MSVARKVVLSVLAISAFAAGLWWFQFRTSDEGPLQLYGNVEFRQISLSFNGSGRIETILVEEGSAVKAGEVLARLGTERLLPQIRQAEAQRAAQQAIVEALRLGTRPELVAQAQANLAIAQVRVAEARRYFDRQTLLRNSAVVSAQIVDKAQSELDTAEAQVVVAQTAVDLALAGPRQQEIDQAEAQRDAIDAQIELLKIQLADSSLRAPVDAVVRSRLMEPGEMASAATPVFQLAVPSPKWLRGYVSGGQLGTIKTGMAAQIFADGSEDQWLAGQLTFISSVAEFTPRTVQTEELRSSLVYEVRFLVDDQDDRLRLGMPVTIRFPGAGHD